MNLRGDVGFLAPKYLVVPGSCRLDGSGTWALRVVSGPGSVAVISFIEFGQIFCGHSFRLSSDESLSEFQLVLRVGTAQILALHIMPTRPRHTPNLRSRHLHRLSLPHNKPSGIRNGEH